MKYLLENHFYLKHYYGYDISRNMLENAKKINYQNTTFICGDRLQTHADYSIASGIFNVVFDEDCREWREYILEVLRNMHKFSEKGFSFNLLTDFVDFKNINLYYADPCYFFEFCRKNFSRKVTLLHDYGLYEWTILVKK